MNPEDVYELIKARKSVRKYASTPIDDKIIDQLLDAARWAPSAGNQQPLEVIVVKEVKQVQERVEATWRQSFIFEAPVVFIICSNPKDTVARYKERGEKLYNIQDTAASIMNIMILAKAYGLDTCWIGAFQEDAISELFNIPDNVRPVALIPIGYAHSDVSAKRTARKDINSIVFSEEYGTPYY